MPIKTFPTKSAGPYYPTAPLKHSLLRLIPGDPRFATPPLKWLTEPQDSLQLYAAFGQDSSTMYLGKNQIPPQFFDFQLPETTEFLSITLVAPTVEATVIFLAADFDDKKGVISRPLIADDGTPIAVLTLDYLIITPGPEITHPRIPKRVPRLSGHRGMGSSGPTAPYRQLENVPASFLSAALPDSRIQGVELDVQLTRDKKTIVYHDWFYRPGGERDNAIFKGDVKMPVYNLTFDQIDSLFRKQNRGRELPESLRDFASIRNDVTADAFTVKMRTLAEVCEVLPEEIELLVEVKYPPPDVQDDEMIPFPEKNEFVNIILEDMFRIKRNAKRNVIFLSFDADICALLAMKQDVYGVYLSHCETMDPPCDMMDPRTIDLDQGLQYSVSQKLDGMMLFNDLVFAKPDAVKRIKNAGLPIITYGGRNSEATFVRDQFEVGVDGVIADDVDQLVELLEQV